MIRRMLFFGLVLALLTGCGRSVVDDTSPPANTIRIEDSCTDRESCCIKSCGDYCISKSAKYEKHVVNGWTCACFCSR